jgi:hypothetical protein
VKKLCQKSTRPLTETETAGVPAGGEVLISTADVTVSAKNTSAKAKML